MLSVPTKDRKGGIHAPMNKGDNNLQYSLSSVGDASARNIWGVLDQGMTSPSLPRSDEENGKILLLAHNEYFNTRMYSSNQTEVFCHEFFAVSLLLASATNVAFRL